MFSAFHWDYLHRQGLVSAFPAELGVAVGGAVDDDLRNQLLSWGMLVEADGGLELDQSRQPVFDAFGDPALKLFGTTLLYREAVPRPEVDANVPEPLRAMAEVSQTVIPQAKFLVAVTDTVVACAVQYRGCIAISGVDCTHTDPVVQGARLLWEALAPGPGYESLQEMTLPMSALAAVARIEGAQGAAKVLSDAAVAPPLSEAVVELLSQQPSAAAQVCVSVWDNHRRVQSDDAAIGLVQFDAGAVLTVPSSRRDGGVYVTYTPASAARWEKAITCFVAGYQRAAKTA